MKVNGWELLQHPLFSSQYEKLEAEVRKLAAADPHGYHNHRSAKLLKRITDLISDQIPSDPGHERFNQGKTLGPGYQHWKRAKFGRYRLFFRYLHQKKGDKEIKVIIYAWVNDEKTLRKEGDKNDPYALFAKGLEKGQPPDSIEELIRASRELAGEQNEKIDDG